MCNYLTEVVLQYALPIFLRGTTPGSGGRGTILLPASTAATLLALLLRTIASIPVFCLVWVVLSVRVLRSGVRVRLLNFPITVHRLHVPSRYTGDVLARPSELELNKTKSAFPTSSALELNIITTGRPPEDSGLLCQVETRDHQDTSRLRLARKR